MAEVFGVVASALAVAELTGKFGVSIVKLKKLWDEIQDVSEEMNRLMRRLEVLKPVLAEMEAEFVQQRHKVYHNSAANLSIEYCRQAVDDLESLAEDLQARISAAKRTRRKLTRLKVSFKKDNIREFQERIDFALQLILLSQQTYIIAVVKSPPVVELVQDPERKSLNTVMGDSQEVQPATSSSVWFGEKRPSGYEMGPKPIPWQRASFFGGLKYKQSQNSFYPYRTVHQLCLQLPKWISQRVFDLQTYRSNVGWQICLKTWVRRPTYSGTFRDVYEGKLSDVERALAVGDASLLDRDGDGRTLLHYAALSGHLDTFKALLSWGLSFTETDDLGFAVSQCVKVMGVAFSNAVFTEIVKLMFDAEALEEEIDAIFSGSWNCKGYIFPLCIWSVPGTFEMIVGNRREEYLQLPPQVRFIHLSWWDVNPGVLPEQLSMGAGVSPAALRAVDGCNENHTFDAYSMEGKSLQSFAQSYFDKIPIGLWDGMDSGGLADEENIHLRTFDGFRSWRKLARWYLAGISLRELTELRRVERDDLTPFFSGLFYAPFNCLHIWQGSRRARLRSIRWIMQSVSRAMRFWLEDVQSAGINLEEYGKRELDIYIFIRALLSDIVEAHSCCQDAIYLAGT
ncbi:hypothetical protein CGMCC3_g11629 [Colletotrichum fructicola]|uniref:Uncharacterized protein n=1 Tax=Colletotrichum fructicola (strain Nara gc5) TaxID=1213859 RepID=A0A7J6J1B0_COLFN|nr:uncharacterized protein CGMCC3_g11629 [Colletotrichum fructicola]KAE9572276.1 hypothetical protein CGMCC3_g11629 [Colletotrichum fructicola]KAF4483332.1 hypothetical protein CGGC5_v010127 [Colletotrichum fructicola Nara gc5]